MRRAIGKRQLAFFIRTRGGDQLVAQRLGPLAGDQAHTTGRRVPQDVVARLQAFRRQRLAQQVLRRQALQHHGGAGLERDVVGQLAHGQCGHHARLAVAAGRVAGVGGAVAGFQVRHALAHRLDDAGALHAQVQRHGQLVQAAALVDVDEVQPDGVVADADLARPGFAYGQVDKLHFFCAAVAGNLDGQGHGGFLG